MESITVKHLLDKHRTEINKQLEYLINVAKRLKLTAPTWELTEVYEHEFSVIVGASGYGEDRDEEYETYIEKCFDITLHVAETLKIDGDWIFACAIDHRAKAMIQVYEDAKIPMRYNPSNDCCEHCGKKYPRVRSYVVLNEKNGEFKQVGKGCLKQFLGINPASYITMFEAVSKFSPMVEGFGRKNSGGRLDDLAYDVKDMLRYTIHQVAKDKGSFVKAEWKEISIGEDWRGFEQFRNVRTNEGEATIDKVKNRLSAIGYLRMNPNFINDTTTVEQLEERMRHYTNRLSLFTGADMKNESRAWRRSGEIEFSIREIKNHIHAVKYRMLLEEAILDYDTEYEAVKSFVNGMVIEESEAGNLSSFDQYRQLLKTVFLKERTLQSNLKTVVSGYGFYLKQMVRAEQDAIRKANAVNLKHIGKLGEKCELVLKIVSYKEGEGMYGTWKKWGMKDDAGNKFGKWGEIPMKFTIIEGDETFSFEQKENRDATNNDVNIGSTISVIAVIKDHTVYRDEKITELGRISEVKKAPYIYKIKKVK